jgi:hypothetical protein
MTRRHLAVAAGAAVLAGVVGVLSGGAFGQCAPLTTALGPAQIGIQGAFTQECNDGQWVGLAFPISVGAGATVDTVSYRLNSNRNGGDIYITENDPGGSCQPDVSQTLATLCCAVSGQATGVIVSQVFGNVTDGDGDGILWVVFTGRSGQSGQNAQGYPNGTNFPSHQVARDNAVASALGRAFANLVGTGNIGDWTDLHTLGGGLGNPYNVALSDTNGAPGTYDCIANPDPTGACCVSPPGCVEMRPFECGQAGPGIYQGSGTTCPDPDCTCGAGAGSCLAPHGTPGCESLACCKVICDPVVGDPFCCDTEWDQNCADAAALNLSACVPNLCPGTPVNIATGASSAVDGYLRVGADIYGSFTSTTYGAGLGDTYNPVGALGPMEATFSTGLFMFADLSGDGINDARELLSQNATFQAACASDNTFIRQNLACGAPFDTNGDAVADTVTSSFRVLAPTGEIDVGFDVTQEVNSLSGGAELVQTYVISNNLGTPASFFLIRHIDMDLLWDPGADFTNDSVGTGTNGNPSLERYVFQREAGMPETSITLSSPDGTSYTGNKGGIDPDGAGDCNAYGYGTDCVFWDAFGLTGNIGGANDTSCWIDHIAGVGTNVDGESGPDAGDPVACVPCDGMILLEIPVSLGGSDTATVVVRTTYGSNAPGGDSCPADCADGDGEVWVLDLLALLDEWGGPGDCDIDGDGTVGYSDLSAILLEWGLCGRSPDGGEMHVGSGPDPFEERFLMIGPDPFGAVTGLSFGGAGDFYNPQGAAGPQFAAFTSGLFVFVGQDRRELLTANAQWQTDLGFESDRSLTRMVTAANAASDGDFDGIDDTLTSQFMVVGDGVGLRFDLVQTVQGDPDGGSMVTQTYHVLNEGPVPVDLEIVWSGDFNLSWFGDLADDVVGTTAARAGPCLADCGGIPDENVGIVDLLALLGTWGQPGDCDIDGSGTIGIGDLLALLPEWGPCAGPSVFIQDPFLAGTRIQVSCTRADAYAGGKRGIDPDGPGSGPAYGMGTDTQVWDDYGLPESWINHIAGVGYDADGESGPFPQGCLAPCDAVIYLRIPMSLGTGPGSGFTIRLRYGALSLSD